MTHIIGIDLGTTSSAVAVYRDGRPVVISTSSGIETPSLVAFNRNGEPSVGRRAYHQAAVSPGDAVYSVKRLLGRHFDDPVVQQVRRQQPFTLRRATDGGVEIYTASSGRAYSPQEVVSMILRYLRLEAEAYLGAPVSQAVLAVPAQFTDRQRQAAREAARLADLDVLRVVNEPTAAALAYGAHKKEAQRRILVVDLGGGHYDVSLLESHGGAVRVYASHGDPGLGAEEWDARISDYLADEFLKYHGVELKRDRHAVHRLRKAAEEAREQLAQAAQTTIDLPFITSGAAGPRHLKITLTRGQFEEATAALKARLARPIEQALADAGFDAAQLDAVLLAGGGARMPALNEVVRRIAGSTPVELAGDLQLVAQGAALQAGQLAGDLHDVTLSDVTPLSLGLETMGGLMTPLIPRNTPFPVRRKEVFSTIEDNQTEVEIHVLQGERSMASDNSKLGVFHLKGIPPAPRGVPQIVVTFEVNADGILHVEARDMASGSCHELRLTTGQAQQQDVQRLVEEAASCEAEDSQKRTLIEAQNLGRQILYQTERCLHHLNGMGGSAECARERREIGEKLSALETAIAAGDLQLIQRLTDEIQLSSTLLNHLVYDSSAGSQQPRTKKGDSGFRGSSLTDIVVEPL